MFEHKGEPLLPFPAFVNRLAYCLLLAAGILGVALVAGIAGYRWIAGLSWIDSILNASMILTGMGPVSQLQTTAAKLFASAYALFSGIVFLSAVAVFLSPVFHRILHSFHIEDDVD